MHESENQKKPKIFCCAGYGSGPADDTSDTACGLPGKDTCKAWDLENKFWIALMEKAVGLDISIELKSQTRL